MKKIIKKIQSFSLMGKISIGIIGGFMILAIFSSMLSPYSHELPSGKALQSPSWDHWLGTDDLGIDIWAQICYGARISIIVGVATALLSVTAGGLIGIFAGYYGGRIDGWMMRLTDLMMIIPQLPMMIVLGAFFGPSLKNIILVLSLFSWTAPVRIVRSKVLSIKEEKYILVAKSYGAGFFYMVQKHFLPQVFSLLMVSFIQLISRAIVAETGLSFLGLGDPTSKSWGLMLNHGMAFRGIFFTEFWKWWILSPLICILTIVLSVAFVGKEIERKEVVDYEKTVVKS